MLLSIPPVTPHMETITITELPRLEYGHTWNWISPLFTWSLQLLSWSSVSPVGVTLNLKAPSLSQGLFCSTCFPAVLHHQAWLPFQKRGQIGHCLPTNLQFNYSAGVLLKGEAHSFWPLSLSLSSFCCVVANVSLLSKFAFKLQSKCKCVHSSVEVDYLLRVQSMNKRLVTAYDAQVFQSSGYREICYM